jgi:hypothetical protein
MLLLLAHGVLKVWGTSIAVDESHNERERELSEPEDCTAIKYRYVSEITSSSVDTWRYGIHMVIENFCWR